MVFPVPIPPLVRMLNLLYILIKVWGNFLYFKQTRKFMVSLAPPFSLLVILQNNIPWNWHELWFWKFFTFYHACWNTFFSFISIRILIYVWLYDCKSSIVCTQLGNVWQMLSIGCVELSPTDLKIKKHICS